MNVLKGTSDPDGQAKSAPERGPVKVCQLVAPRLFVFPTDFAFDNAVIGQPASQSFAVSNAGGGRSRSARSR